MDHIGKADLLGDRIIIVSMYRDVCDRMNIPTSCDIDIPVFVCKFPDRAFCNGLRPTIGRPRGEVSVCSSVMGFQS
jgi:hypothetical protein